jgi:hypothetical protein
MRSKERRMQKGGRCFLRGSTGEPFAHQSEPLPQSPVCNACLLRSKAATWKPLVCFVRSAGPLLTGNRVPPFGRLRRTATALHLGDFDASSFYIGLPSGGRDHASRQSEPAWLTEDRLIFACTSNMRLGHICVNNANSLPKAKRYSLWEPPGIDSWNQAECIFVIEFFQYFVRK